MQDESPVAAVTRVLSTEFNITKPSIRQTMMLIDAVQQALPPHPDATIASLRAILRDLHPANGLEGWAIKCAREITGWLSEQEQLHKVAVTLNNEHLWCALEGTLAGMLLRVTSGKDLKD